MEKAIEDVALLLDMSTEVRDKSFGFFPIVVISLIQIASSFVQAGVNRAPKKQRHRTGVDVDNDRDLDVYSSLDRFDLGGTVYTNSIVHEKLCQCCCEPYMPLTPQTESMMTLTNLTIFKPNLESLSFYLTLVSS